MLGKKMTPRIDALTSKSESGTESDWPSITSALRSDGPAAAARSRRRATMPGAKSVASTLPPARAASRLKAPLPAATLSTRSPGLTFNNRNASAANCELSPSNAFS
jgi:hypothetical protein